MSTDLTTSWPPEISHLTIICPYCSANNQVDIRLCREEDLPGRIDECRACKEWFIIEKASEGIEFFKSKMSIFLLSSGSIKANNGRESPSTPHQLPPIIRILHSCF